MKFQYLACAVAIASGGLFFNSAITQATAANNAQQVVQGAIKPNAEQQLVARQVAALVDRQHYLPMRLNAATSSRILDMYIDTLDQQHSLFLASDIAKYKQLYGSRLGEMLKAGDLSVAYNIHADYRNKMTAFYQFMLNELKKPQNLYQPNQMVETEREDAPFFNTLAEQQQYWRKVLVTELISMTINREEELAKQKAIKANPALLGGQVIPPPEDLTPVQTLSKRYQRRLDRIGRLKSDDVLESILNATLASYDPHSNYYAPLEAIELNRQSSLQLEGVGVSIRRELRNHDYTSIATILDGGPASKTGQVRPGDRIIGVAQDGEEMIDVIGWDGSEIVGLIRGKRGTKVTLKLIEVGQSINQARLVTITRDIIEEEDAGVRARVLEVPYNGKKYKIGVLEIPSFYLNYRARLAGNKYRSVSEDTANALVSLKKDQVDGVVVDLRNNPGGSLEEVAKMLGQVIKSGPVVQIRDGQGNVTVLEDEDGGQQLYTGPLAVMINLASASASEIYSAAIQDYGRGVIVGRTTTGKGTAQIQLDSLAYGQMTLTQRKFYRITGGSTQNKGVIPDVELVNIYGDDDKNSERDSKYALNWDTIPTAPFSREGSVKPYVSQLQALSKKRVAQDPQFKYLEQMNDITVERLARKELVLDINQRKKDILEVEKETLTADNLRRAATGLKPFPNWESFQASKDATNEARAKMKASERPALPEDEAFVLETARILIDLNALQQKQKS